MAIMRVWAWARSCSFSTSKLTPEDREAIVEYLLSLPPIENTEAKATKAGSAWD